MNANIQAYLDKVNAQEESHDDFDDESWTYPARIVESAYEAPEHLPAFVYGTLRPGHGNYSWALQGKTVFEEDGFLCSATMYSNGGFPYVFDEDGAKGVVGTVIHVSEQMYPSIMDSLDSLEGTRGREIPGLGNFGNNNHYNRVIREIKLADGSTINAWVYMPPEDNRENIKATCQHIPSGDWDIEEKNIQRRRWSRYRVPRDKMI